MEKILKNIEAIRKEKRIKQEIVAKELGVRQSAYSNYVNRSNDIPFSRLSRIADILGVSVVDIIVYPEKWVPENTIIKSCDQCIEKDKTIAHLNQLVSLLEGKFEFVKMK